MFNPNPKPSSNIISIEEYKKLVTPKSKNKFNAIRQTYNGYSYDSKREARHAWFLDHSEDVLKWERQHKIKLQVNGLHIANYFIDFKVWKKEGIEYHEVKGAETMLWRLKWKLTKALYPDYKLIIIK